MSAFAVMISVMAPGWITVTPDAGTVANFGGKGFAGVYFVLFVFWFVCLSFGPEFLFVFCDVLDGFLY